MKKIFISLKPNRSTNSNGGGNFFVLNFENFFKSNNFKITYELEDNIDLILVIDPRKNKNFNKDYSFEDILNYKKKNRNVKIIYRVNENDIKREKSIHIEELLVDTMKKVDHVVFVSEWLKNYYIEKYKLNIKCNSIINGCDNNIFYPKKNKQKFMNNKIKLITHHHSNNYLKGFHIYNQIDKLLKNNKNIEFTFVGNYHPDYKPKNINLLPSCHGSSLADLIRNHDIYLTATQYEPGAMHYVEGLSCGLPVLYCKNGGGAHEVCKKSGEEYNDLNSMINKMELIKKNYDNYVNLINYDYLGHKRCCEEYLKLISKILK